VLSVSYAAVTVNTCLLFRECIQWACAT